MDFITLLTCGLTNTAGIKRSYHSFRLDSKESSQALDDEDAELPDIDLLELVIRDIGLEYIPRRTIRVQKYYMRRGLFMGPSTSVQQFVERLNDLNHYVLYFPEDSP